MTTANNHQRRGNCAPAISYLCLHSQLCDDTKLNAGILYIYIIYRGKEDENENENEENYYINFFFCFLFVFILLNIEEENDFIQKNKV